MPDIKDAIQFVQETTIEPALDHPDLEKEYLGTVRHSRTLLEQFKKIGDLYLYLNRFSENQKANAISERFLELGLKNFEDILEQFKERFSTELHDCTNLDNFIIGENYTSWDIAIFSRAYDVRKGIYLIGPEDNYRAIFVKATLGGEGKYPNKWLIPNLELKYYFKSIKDRFSKTYKENAAIINSKDTPIYVFKKTAEFRNLCGIFRYAEHKKDADGSMWFRLVKSDLFDHQRPTRTDDYFRDLNQRVASSQQSGRGARQKRLATASARPRAVLTTTVTYQRNPDVIAEVLGRANGFCERCKNPAPFIRAANSTPYLEVHHTIPLAQGGDDTVANALALCPNCHRQLHHGLTEEIAFLSEPHPLESDTSGQVEEIRRRAWELSADVPDEKIRAVTQDIEILLTELAEPHGLEGESVTPTAFIVEQHEQAAFKAHRKIHISEILGLTALALLDSPNRTPNPPEVANAKEAVSLAEKLSQIRNVRSAAAGQRNREDRLEFAQWMQANRTNYRSERAAMTAYHEASPLYQGHFEDVERMYRQVLEDIASGKLQLP